MEAVEDLLVLHTFRVPLSAPGRLSPILLAIPLGILAAAAAVLGASVSPLLPVAVGGGVIVIAVGYWRPIWLVYLALVVLPLEFELHPVAFFELSPSKTLFLIAAAMWVVSQIVNGRPLIADSRLTLPLILLVVTVIPGLVVAEHPIIVFNKLAIWTASFFLFQAVIQADDEKIVRNLLTAFAIGGLGLGLLAISDTSFHSQAATGGGGFVSDRATGGQASPNGMAALLITTLLPAIALSFAGPFWRRVGFGAAASIGLVALLLTQSRGGFLAIAAGILILITWRPIRRLALVGIVALAFVSLIGLNPLGDFLGETAVGERISSIPEATVSNPRIPVYRKTLEVIADHPIFGVGTSDFQAAAVEYGITASGVAVTHPHNGPLTIAAERGLIGLAVFIYFAFALGVLLKDGLAGSSGERKAMLTAVLAVFVAITAHLMVDYTLGGPVFLAELFVLAGCAVVLTRAATREVTEDEGDPVPPHGVALGPPSSQPAG